MIHKYGIIYKHIKSGKKYIVITNQNIIQTTNCIVEHNTNTINNNSAEIYLNYSISNLILAHILSFIYWLIPDTTFYVRDTYEFHRKFVNQTHWKKRVITNADRLAKHKELEQQYGKSFSSESTKYVAFKCCDNNNLYRVFYCDVDTTIFHPIVYVDKNGNLVIPDLSTACLHNELPNNILLDIYTICEQIKKHHMY